MLLLFLRSRSARWQWRNQAMRSGAATSVFVCASTLTFFMHVICPFQECGPHLGWTSSRPTAHLDSLIQSGCEMTKKPTKERKHDRLFLPLPSLTVKKLRRRRAVAYGRCPLRCSRECHLRRQLEAFLPGHSFRTMERPHDPTVSLPCRSKPRYGYLSEGSKVEVTSMDEGFVDSWFEAKVVKPPEHPKSSLKSKRLTLIEYVNLVNEKGTRLLKEKVDMVLLRPLPPKVLMEGDDHFREGDLVDCFERDGWWTGKVKTVVTLRNKEEGERYLARFEDPEHEIEFRREDMRVHLDWMNGKWFHLQDGALQEMSITADGQVTLANNHCCSGTEELVEPELPLVMGISAESFVDDPATLLDQTLSPDLSAICQQETIYVEYPNSSSTHSLPSKKLKRPCADPFVHVSTKPAEITIEDSNGASLFVKPAVGWRNNGFRPLRDCQHKETGGKSDPDAKSGHCFKRRKIKKQLSEGIPVALVAAEVDDVHKDQSMEEHSLMAVGRELTHEKKGEVQVDENVREIPCMEDQSLVSVGTEMTHKGHGEVQKAMNGHKNLSLELEAEGTEVTHGELDEVQVDENVHKIPCMEEQLPVSVGTEMTHKGHGEVQRAENVHKHPSLELEALGTEETREEQGTSNLAADALGPGTEGMRVVLNEGQCWRTDVNGTSQSLPFIKASPIWKAVEALEIFRLFPQKLHFRPLIDAKEGAREGLAIANMVTFATTVEEVRNLSVHSRVSCFTECLHTLRGLESHGFNTKTIERRVSKLHSIKRTQEKVDEKKKEVHGQILELKHKNDKVMEDIYENDRKIKFYKQQLELALLEKEENDLEIARMMTGLDVIDTVMDSALFDFAD